MRELLKGLLLLWALSLFAGCSSGGGTRPTPPPLYPVKLNWTTPDANDDESPLRLKGYYLNYGRSGFPLYAGQNVPAEKNSITLSLPAGSWDFQIRAAGLSADEPPQEVLSDPSNKVTKVVP